MANPSVQVLRKTLEHMLKNSAFAKHTVPKLNITDGDKGCCLCEMNIDQPQTNLQGMLHGGCAATLVDIVSTLVLSTIGTGSLGVTTDMNITYLKPAKLGETIVIEANALKVGKTLAFLTVDIRNKASGKLLVQGRHTKFVGS